MNAAEITDKLGLHSLRQRAWVSTAAVRCDQSASHYVPRETRFYTDPHLQYIQSTCATSGDGLYEGLEWLATTLRKAGHQ